MKKRQLGRRQLAHGIVLIEALIALLIIAISLMGTAALQVTAMRVNKGGQLRNQAVFLASDLAERIEANKDGAVAGSYVVLATATAPAADNVCDISDCNASALALYDLSLWQNWVASALPQSSWSVVQTVAGNPTTYTITINWKERRSGGGGGAGASTNYSTIGTDESFAYTTQRTVFTPPN